MLIKPRAIRLVVVAVVTAFAAIPAAAANNPIPPAALMPDLATVVPQHLQLVNKQQQEIIRFSNGIANIGAGDLRLRPGFPASEDGDQEAIQELLDASGDVLHSEVVSVFDYHPDHNHWHLDAVARFEIRADDPYSGRLVGSSVKVTFCLIDWYKLEGPSRTPDRRYTECNAGYQGISPGWVDQYHHATVGQTLNITGEPPGLYYLVSTANPDGNYLESDQSNNTAWTAFQLTRDSKGNPKIEVAGHSPCVGAMCGDKAPNR